MNKLMPLLLASLTTLAGCDNVRDRYSEHQNHNNGEQGNLAFSEPPLTRLGGTAFVEVWRAEVGQFDCATYTVTNWFWGTSRDEVRCRFADQVAPVEAITDARCPDGGCSVAVDGVTLRVTGLAAGAHRLTVAARLTDGTVLADATTVRFEPVAEIALGCSTTRCPGPHAVFPGASFTWSPTALASGAVVAAELSVSVDPPGIVEANLVDGAIAVRALRPGLATVRVSTAGVARTQTVRVVSIDEVVAGDVRSLNTNAQYGALRAEESIVGDEVGQRVSEFPVFFVPVWVLGDGTFALGGAARVTSPSGVEVRAPSTDGPIADDVSEMFIMVGGVDCRAGRTDLTARLGNAVLDWSYIQECL